MSKPPIRLTPVEKADACSYLVIVGAVAVCLAASISSVAGTQIPFSLRMTFMAIFGVVFNVGLWRLHRAAAGSRPFTDDTFDRLEHWRNGGSASLFQYKDTDPDR